VVRKKRSGASRSKRISAGTRVSKSGLTCIGDICYNPDTGKIEVKLNRKSCAPETIKSIVEGVVKGSEVEFVMPKPEKHEEVKKEV
jgi:hypothetical protein